MALRPSRSREKRGGGLTTSTSNRRALGKGRVLAEEEPRGHCGGSKEEGQVGEQRHRIPFQTVARGTAVAVRG